MTITADDFKGFLERYESLLNSGVPFLIVDWVELKEWNQEIAEEILKSPDDCLFEFSKATSNFVSSPIPIFIKNVSTKVSLRKLGAKHLGKLVGLDGVICRVVPTRPMIKRAAFKCRKCGNIIKLTQDEPFLLKPDKCGAQITKKRTCKSRTFRLLEDPRETDYIDVQELAVQEKPEDLKAGQAPQLINLEITKDSLINGARAGDIVDLVGILRTVPPSATSLKRKWAKFIDVNYIEVMNKDPSDIVISPEEEEKIRWIASDSDIFKKIITSIAPSIYGCEHIKESVIYQLFGGCRKQYSDRVVRGNIHVLWIDDPSTAKSQILMAAKNLAPRGLYVSGGGASGAGLTAAVVKVEGDLWALEAGAVVLANKGICCIDEIEKMNDDDRARIHEAMAQQTVNIQKATAHYTLPAETAILAAGNPTFGRYDTYKTISENISLPTTILSRFDLIFIGKGDVPDEKRDEAISSHILEEPEKFESFISKDLFRKYIALAKKIKPKMTDEARNHIKEFYKKMRVLNSGSGKEQCPIVITARQLEGLVRIAEAHARVRLSDKVEGKDAEAATKIMMKSLKQVGIDPETGEFDIDAMMGRPKTIRDRTTKIMAILSDREEHSVDDIVEKLGIPQRDVKRCLVQMLSDGTIYNPDTEGKLYKSVR